MDIKNQVAGIPIINKDFSKTEVVRLWEITYLDDEVRVLRARMPETPREDAFIFVFVKDEAARGK